MERSPEFEPRREETSVIVFDDKRKPELVILKKKKILLANETGEAEPATPTLSDDKKPLLPVLPEDLQIIPNKPNNHETEPSHDPDFQAWWDKFIANLPINPTPKSLPSHKTLLFQQPPKKYFVNHLELDLSDLTGHDHQAGTPITPSEFSTDVAGRQQRQTSETDTPSIQLWEPITIPPKEWWDVRKNEFAMLPDHRFGHFELEVKATIKPPPSKHLSLREGHDHQAGTPILPSELPINYAEPKVLKLMPDGRNG